MNPTYVPILAAIVAVLGGAFAYWNQKRIDRRAALTTKRREAYEAYLHAYLYTDSKERLEQLNYARMTLALIASDEVLRRIADLDQYVISTNPSGPERDIRKLKNLMTTVVGAMRHDVFERTNLAEGELERTLPIQ